MSVGLEIVDGVTLRGPHVRRAAAQAQPGSDRRFGAQVDSSRKWIALTGVTRRSIGWSVNAVGDAWHTVTR